MSSVPNGLFSTKSALSSRSDVLEATIRGCFRSSGTRESATGSATAKSVAPPPSSCACWPTKSTSASRRRAGGRENPQLLDLQPRSRLRRHRMLAEPGPVQEWGAWAASPWTAARESACVSEAHTVAVPGPPRSPPHHDSSCCFSHWQGLSRGKERGEACRRGSRTA